jgi:hypothetical protein
VPELWTLGALAHPTKTRKKNTMKTINQTLKLGLAALLFAMTSSTLQAAPPHTGIQGRAALYISYGTPVEIEPGVWLGVGDVMLPVATSFRVLSAHSGHEVGRFSADADGAFTVSLPPGKYVVIPDTLIFGGFPFAQSISTGSFEVTVSAKKFTYALILYYHDGPFSLFSGTHD